ncbi:MAG: hypothetical protein RIT34_1215 [Bacteroidota bacterium]|jgi:hypothetical protein
MEIQKCHEWYVSERGTFLSIDHFSSMIMMLPATMVACSDGDFDELEKQNLANSCKEIDANEHVGFEVYAELCHLVGAGAADQRSKVLDCIKTELSKDASNGELIVEMMTEMADSSDGISSTEAAKISEIRNMLSI